MTDVESTSYSVSQGDKGHKKRANGYVSPSKVRASDDASHPRRLLPPLPQPFVLVSVRAPGAPAQKRRLTFKNSRIRSRSSWLSCVMNLASSRGQKALSCWAEGDDVGAIAAAFCCCCSSWAGAVRCRDRTASLSNISVAESERGRERGGGGGRRKREVSLARSKRNRREVRRSNL